MLCSSSLLLGIALFSGSTQNWLTNSRVFGNSLSWRIFLGFEYSWSRSHTFLGQRKTKTSSCSVPNRLQNVLVCSSNACFMNAEPKHIYGLAFNFCVCSLRTKIQGWTRKKGTLFVVRNPDFCTVAQRLFVLPSFQFPHSPAPRLEACPQGPQAQ
ncbi:hypothetical protein B0H19DRAFT_1159987, partial [Mycena capillaripes]